MRPCIYLCAPIVCDLIRFHLWGFLLPQGLPQLCYSVSADAEQLTSACFRRHAAFVFQVYVHWVQLLDPHFLVVLGIAPRVSCMLQASVLQTSLPRVLVVLRYCFLIFWATLFLERSPCYSSVCKSDIFLWLDSLKKKKCYYGFEAT